MRVAVTQAWLFLVGLFFCLPALAAGLNFIRLATPTTDDARLPAVLAHTSGFVYYVSITGITGAAAPLRLKVLTTVGASEYALAQSGWPKDRARLIRYEGGHTAYTIEKSLKALMADVRSFVSGK